MTKQQKQTLIEIAVGLEGMTVIVPARCSMKFIKSMNISVSNYNDFPIEIIVKKDLSDAIKGD